ncbi:hypothetical protein BDR26DRAFT_858434 [Obelidium mucronatum]|nr:hypothetical protein BDR26DRAFT_858434 [Obelidium mucronatum]
MHLLSAILLAATAASAHFVITSPASRPFDEDGQPFGPCGGQTLGKRTAFPLVGGTVAGALYHPSATANFSIVISNTDPTASQFGQVPIGPGFNVKLTEGPFQTDAFDLSAIPGAVDGANATMQVAVNTVDGILYICADVTLDKSLTKNVAVTTTTRKGSVATSTTTAVSTAGSKSTGFANSSGGVIPLLAVLISFVF